MPRTRRVEGSRHVMLGVGRPASREEEKVYVMFGKDSAVLAVDVVRWVQD